MSDRFRFSEDDGHSYDVLAVNLVTSHIRFMAENETKPNAEAVVNFAIMRRGLEEEFYPIVPHGKYKEGDTWVRQPPTRSSPPRRGRSG